MDHAACREHAEADRAATEKFRAAVGNPYGLVPPRILRNSELLQNFLREGAGTNFEMSRQKRRDRERAIAH